MLRLISSGLGEEDHVRQCDYCNREEEDPDPTFFDYLHQGSEDYLDFCSLFCLYKWLESQIRVGVVK